MRALVGEGPGRSVSTFSGHHEVARHAQRRALESWRPPVESDDGVTLHVNGGDGTFYRVVVDKRSGRLEASPVCAGGVLDVHELTSVRNHPDVDASYDLH